MIRFIFYSIIFYFIMKVINYFFRKPVRQRNDDFRGNTPKREDREVRINKEKINREDVIEAEFEEIKSDKK
ncbi:hypothetical protein APF79_08030 [bacterium BRH_c32]|nr:MAG: hypothetical protein APF79_08030 [bacterium BRH_c32]